MPRKLNILVAEDDHDDFFFLHRLLHKAAVGSVYHVEDGQQVIDYLSGAGPYADRAAHPFPDVLLLDLKLPVRSGHQVLEWIGNRRAPQRPTTYILSGSAYDVDQQRAEKAGAAGFFLKPLSLGHIAALFDEEALPVTA